MTTNVSTLLREFPEFRNTALAGEKVIIVTRGGNLRLTAEPRSGPRLASSSLRRQSEGEGAWGFAVAADDFVKICTLTPFFPDPIFSIPVKAEPTCCGHRFALGVLKNASTSPTGLEMKTSCFLNQPFRASLTPRPR